MDIDIFSANFLGGSVAIIWTLTFLAFLTGYHFTQASFLFYIWDKHSYYKRLRIWICQSSEYKSFIKRWHNNDRIAELREKGYL